MPPQLRGALTRGCLIVVGSLGSGGISEAASLGEQSWRLSGGVLGETALPGFWVMSREEWDALTRGFTHAKSAKSAKGREY